MDEKIMKIIYVTNTKKDSQCDFQEVSTLNGLREILGDDCIDFPRKKIMYGDFSESPKDELHGWGFSLLTYPIQEVSNREVDEVDFVLYGVTDGYGIKNIPEIDRLAKHGVWYLDGHDHSKITKTPCFKRELFESHENVFPTGFGIPEHRIRPIDFSNKTQIAQKTAPPYACFGPQILGPTARKLYVFTNEEEYYNDMASSYFGLTCMKGGWDSLRHYEILASGACLLFRDYDQKPKLCSPQNLPCVSYSSPQDLEAIVNRLIVNNTPTQEYVDLVNTQREWLIKHGTTKARAKKILEVLGEKHVF
tara:strand:+ start:23887 stop:24804 length:918 start_codon:yes stop_codon:yes gene_type:complete